MKVHDSQAYRKMAVTREHIRCILELREMILSFQTGFNLVNAAVVCAILESISGSEPSSVIIVSKIFCKADTFHCLHSSYIDVEKRCDVRKARQVSVGMKKPIVS